MKEVAHPPVFGNFVIMVMVYDRPFCAFGMTLFKGSMEEKIQNVVEASQSLGSYITLHYFFLLGPKACISLVINNEAQLALLFLLVPCSIGCWGIGGE